MTARELQELQIRNRLEEGRDGLDFVGELVREARDMTTNGRAAALRTIESKLHEVWKELGAVAEGETKRTPVQHEPVEGRVQVLQAAEVAAEAYTP